MHLRHFEVTCWNGHLLSCPSCVVLTCEVTCGRRLAALDGFPEVADQTVFAAW